MPNTVLIAPIVRVSVLLIVERFLLTTNGMPIIVVKKSMPMTVPTPNSKIYITASQTLCTVLIVNRIIAPLPAKPWTKPMNINFNNGTLLCSCL